MATHQGICGGSCVEGFARYFRPDVAFNRGFALHATSHANSQYVIVHVYLIPRTVTQRRQLCEAIESELDALKAVRLHELAFALPACRGDERRVAFEAWDGLTAAGTKAAGEGKPDAWETGDAVYVRYSVDGQMAVLAAAPATKRLLPQPP